MKNFYRFISESVTENYGKIARDYCEKLIDLMKPFNLNTYDNDNRGHYNVLYDKFINIKKVIIEKFPDFERIQRKRGYDIKKYGFYEEYTFRNKNLMFYLSFANEGDGGICRMRLWIGAEGHLVNRSRFMDGWSENRIGGWGIGPMGSRIEHVKWDEIGEDFTYIRKNQNQNPVIDPFGEEVWEDED